MSALVKRMLTVAALGVWGTVMTYIYFGGRVDDYLHPAFRIGVGVSGVILLFMAALILLTTESDGHDHTSCDHDHDHESGWISTTARLCILIVPVVGAAVVSPGEFSATLVRNRGMVTSVKDLPGYEPSKGVFVEPALPTAAGPGDPADAEEYSALDFLPRDEQGRVEAELIDLLYAAEEPMIRSDFEDLEVSLTGQFLPADQNNPNGDRFNLIRFMILCCAADARPVTLLVQGNIPADIQEMEWVNIKGRATFPVEGGRSTAVVEADSIERTEPPEASFVY